MSHDIDLIVTRPQLALIKAITEDMSESRHLAGRKWRATLSGIHLDLYVPHVSRLGENLQLRTEMLVRRKESVGDWVVLDPPGHIATKFAALLDRPDTNPGEKDRLEILALLDQGVDAAEAVRVFHEASTRASQEVTELIGKAFTYLGDIQVSRDMRRNLKELASTWREYSTGFKSPDVTRAGLDAPGPQQRGPSLGL